MNDIKMPTQGLANLEVFAATLESLAAVDRNIIAVTSDSRGSGKLTPFGQKFPKQIIEVGIAEQNLVGVAAGLASAGKTVFAVSPACFLTARALEQIKNDVAYSNNAVILVGISAGVSYGALGTTHHSLHDYAVLRAINNLIVVAPADNFETEQAILQAAALNKPIYLRFGKKAMPFNLVISDWLLATGNEAENQFPNNQSTNNQFQLGKGRIVREGSDITFIGTGETVLPAFEAAEKLAAEHGIQAKVVSMHTIKPLDYELINTIASEGKPIITVEEHMINGGLGEAVASYLMQNSFRNSFKIMGIPDEYTVTGSQNEIFNHYDITGVGIAKEALKLMNQ
ncbi:transketolase C-terminal domain-containing protein [Arcicella sp. LKC2W]|uniref:transketolase family protein n=1 Tax=Arcicella sp. LKC2W TaxID=2984198 RepID=UPI002B20F988|nr:transketolase C-terminal domain-containing protein [Arcicella sp. LKC2W]MEA5460432.1 transketolase C-terminal domain-containing protein [Arcicella sp. LKC2W]